MKSTDPPRPPKTVIKKHTRTARRTRSAVRFLVGARRQLQDLPTADTYGAQSNHRSHVRSPCRSQEGTAREEKGDLIIA